MLYCMTFCVGFSAIRHSSPLAPSKSLERGFTNFTPPSMDLLILPMRLVPAIFDTEIATLPLLLHLTRPDIPSAGIEELSTSHGTSQEKISIVASIEPFFALRVANGNSP